MGQKTLCFLSWTQLLAGRGNGEWSITPGVLLAVQCWMAVKGRERRMGRMEVGLCPTGCTPTREGRANQCCAWQCTHASSHHAKCHPASSHCAGFSSPCFRIEGRITLMLENQYPWGRKLHPFPTKKDGEERSILHLPKWSTTTWLHRLGRRLSPSQTKGLMQLQV